MEKHLGAGFEAGVEGLKAWKLEQNNMTKKADFFFGPQNVRKSRRAKIELPQFKIPVAPVADQISFNRFATIKGPKLDPPGGGTFKGLHFLTPFLTRFLCMGVQNWTRKVESGFSLEVWFLSPPKHLLQLRWSNAETHQRHTSQHRVGNKDLEQGRAHAVS